MRFAAAALVAYAVVGSAATTPAQHSEVVERGKQLYGIYCSGCHGTGGRGDGDTAQYLKITPTDLTKLVASGEEFPFDRVYRVIDGRQPVRGHGAKQMPIWGLTFQDTGSDANQEDEVRGKILQLIEYLESIQREP